jgi:hypothetical protein
MNQKPKSSGFHPDVIDFALLGGHVVSNRSENRRHKAEYYKEITKHAGYDMLVYVLDIVHFKNKISALIVAQFQESAFDRCISKDISFGYHPREILRLGTCQEALLFQKTEDHLVFLFHNEEKLFQLFHCYR